MFTPTYIVPGSNYLVTVDLNNFLASTGGTYYVTAEVKYSDTVSYIVSKTAIFSESKD